MFELRSQSRTAIVPCTSCHTTQSRTEQRLNFQLHAPTACHLCRVLAGTNSRLHYVGCGGPLLLTSSGNLNATLVPDGMHPSATAYELMFAQCW